MAELKTKQTDASVEVFLRKIPDPERQRDCRAVAQLMREATGAEPRMWGTSIVGFGSYRYRGATGEREWFPVGFSPRKQDLTLYILAGFERNAVLMKRLGKYKTGKSCLYLKRLADVDLGVLRQIIEQSVRPRSRRAGRTS
jgi:hypothetical protein